MPLLETKGAASAQGFGLTSAVAAANYIEDVFQTYLYSGSPSNNTITNGIDLAGKGGLVWMKSRTDYTTSGYNHALYDTERGNLSRLLSNTTGAASTGAGSTYMQSFNSNGFTLVGNGFLENYSPQMVSWAFREQPKFFDVVTYTGNGSNRTIAHSLGSVPGCIIVKRTDTSADWQVYHRSNANTEYMVLNSSAAKATGATRWNSTTPTSTVFSLGTDATVNASGGTYVAYLFAHDAGGFGVSGSDNAISCGSYTGNGSATGPSINLGYEPQWLMIKNASGVGGWIMFDNMRGMPVGTTDAWLFANTADSEQGGASLINPTATGFQITTTSTQLNSSGSNYIYIAIRRPNKPPTTGTQVFSPVVKAAGTTVGTEFSVGFPYDMYFGGFRTTVANRASDSRLTQNYTSNTSSFGHLYTTTVNAETSGEAPLAYQIGKQNSLAWGNWVSTTYDAVMHFFRRAPGFFDVVCYTGTGSATTFNHNLGVVPELMIVKKRSASDDWAVYANNDNTDFLLLNTTAATADDNTYWNDTSPTASVFTVGTNADVNTSAATYVAYLFATVAGVSKVGSYTGTGTTLQVNCGFTGGSRFVMVKRTDSTGDWYVWDSARGIVAGNDPYLLLNSIAAEVTGTDYVDTFSSGFEISSTAPAAINANGGTFIFLAIA
jgi:hypothetical protein